MRRVCAPCVCECVRSHHRVPEGSCSGRSAGCDTRWVVGTFCSSAITHRANRDVSNAQTTSVHFISAMVGILFVCECVCIYRVAMTVFVQVPGSVEAPLHLWNRVWRFCQLGNKSKKEAKRVSGNADWKKSPTDAAQHSSAIQLNPKLVFAFFFRLRGLSSYIYFQQSRTIHVGAAGRSPQKDARISIRFSRKIWVMLTGQKGSQSYTGLLPVIYFCYFCFQL